MTRGDVFIQILSEVSGKPKESVFELLEFFKSTIPGQHKFDEELPDGEAEALLTGLRQEKEGIKAWLMTGYQRFLLKNSRPAGSA